MKIYVNRKPVFGPWGGGSKVLSAILKALTMVGHEIVHDLVPGIDVLLVVDPRPGSEKGLYGYNEIYQYAQTSPLRPKIVQRVGDIGSHGKPDLTKMVLASAYYSDTVIFPSQWARDYVSYQLEIIDKRPTKQWHVVPNAPMRQFFGQRRDVESLPGKLSFVTHHWSTNSLKGFECYKQLEPHLMGLGHSFTFIGRQPEGPGLINAREPMNEKQLAEELPKHDIYVTASLAEAGANHVLEAVAAGLPVIYHQNGGSINEYCAQFGVAFDGTIESFDRALDHVRAMYPRLRRNIKKYRTTVDDQAMKYVSIIEAIRG